MGQQKTMTAAGSALRRIVLLVAMAAVVAAMTMAMAAGPAVAKNSNQEEPHEPHDSQEPGPPGLSGKGFDGTIVAHCKAVDGSDSSLVINIPKEKISGGGDCNPFPSPLP